MVPKKIKATKSVVDRVLALSGLNGSPDQRRALEIAYCWGAYGAEQGYAGTGEMIEHWFKWEKSNV